MTEALHLLRLSTTARVWRSDLCVLISDLWHRRRLRIPSPERRAVERAIMPVRGQPALRATPVGAIPVARTTTPVGLVAQLVRARA
jgi:hypothetical protein